MIITKEFRTWNSTHLSETPMSVPVPTHALLLVVLSCSPTSLAQSSNNLTLSPSLHSTDPDPAAVSLLIHAFILPPWFRLIKLRALDLLSNPLMSSAGRFTQPQSLPPLLCCRISSGSHGRPSPDFHPSPPAHHFLSPTGGAGRVSLPRTQPPQ